MIESRHLGTDSICGSGGYVITRSAGDEAEIGLRQAEDQESGRCRTPDTMNFDS
jgi:hypothetical protein